MRFSSYLTTALTAIGLLAASSSQAATITWQGDVSSDFSVGGNWDTGSVPGGSDKAVIPDVTLISAPELSANVTVGQLEVQNKGTLTTNEFTLTVSSPSGLDIKGGSHGGAVIVSGNVAETVGGKLEISGGGASHLITSPGKVELTQFDSTFKVSSSATVGFSGSAGTILGSSDSSVLEVPSGVLFISDVILQGGMDFTGSGTFRNTEAVRATSDMIILFGASLILSDVAGAEWKVDDAEFEFDKAHTGNNALLGDLKLYGGGLLDFDANMEFNNGGAGTATFTWFAGTVNIASGATFTYEAFSTGGGACPNPDTSGGAGDPPYEVSGTYVVTCP